MFNLYLLRHSNTTNMSLFKFQIVNNFIPDNSCSLFYRFPGLSQTSVFLFALFSRPKWCIIFTKYPYIFFFP